MANTNPRGWKPVVWLAVVWAIAVTPAAAQDPDASWLTGRLTIAVNGGVQVGSQELTDQFSYRAYGEDAEFTTTHQIEGGLIVDVGGSLRLWRELSLGASFTQLQTTDSTVVTGQVPHPIVANLPRSVPQQMLELDHREQVVHVSGAWRVPVNDRLSVSVFGGGSFFNVTQGVVTNLTVAEAGGPPFSTVTVDRLQQGEHRRNTVGGHGGIDITYMLSSSVGAGVLARFSRATVDLPAAGGGTRSLTVGGAQVGAGLRVRF